MHVRRQSYAGSVPQALACALAGELLGRYGGRHSSGAEPPASHFEPPDGRFGLYESAGYGQIARYGPYVDDERSVCFEKALA